MINYDITANREEVKKAREFLKIAKEQAEADDLKTEFIRNMEHDIKLRN